MKKLMATYGAECGKLYRSKGFKIVLIIMALCIILSAVMFAVIGSVNEGMLKDLLASDMGLIEDTELGLQTYKAELEKLDALEASGAISNSPLNTARVQIEGRIALYEYLIENDLQLSQVDVYTVGNMMFQTKQAIGFMRMALMLLAEVCIIYAIVLSASSIAGERRDGTLKLTLLRPISRATLLSAKLKAVITVSMSALIIGALVSSIYGLIAYDAFSLPSLFVVDGKWVSSVSGFGVYSIEFFNLGVKLVSYTLLTFLLGNLTNNKVSALVITLALLLGGEMLAKYAGMIYIGYAGFVTNLNYESLLTINGGLLRGQSIISSSLVTFAYWLIMLGLNYFVFSKKDFN